MVVSFRGHTIASYLPNDVKTSLQASGFCRKGHHNTLYLPCEWFWLELKDRMLFISWAGDTVLPSLHISNDPGSHTHIDGNSHLHPRKASIQLLPLVLPMGLDLSGEVAFAGAGLPVLASCKPVLSDMGKGGLGPSGPKISKERSQQSMISIDVGDGGPRQAGQLYEKIRRKSVAGNDRPKATLGAIGRIGVLAAARMTSGIRGEPDRPTEGKDVASWRPGPRRY